MKMINPHSKFVNDEVRAVCPKLGYTALSAISSSIILSIKHIPWSIFVYYIYLDASSVYANKRDNLLSFPGTIKTRSR